eukprot:CFRG0084T1
MAGEKRSKVKKSKLSRKKEEERERKGTHRTVMNDMKDITTLADVRTQKKRKHEEVATMKKISDVHSVDVDGGEDRDKKKKLRKDKSKPKKRKSTSKNLKVKQSKEKKKSRKEKISKKERNLSTHVDVRDNDEVEDKIESAVAYASVEEASGEFWNPNPTPEVDTFTTACDKNGQPSCIYIPPNPLLEVARQKAVNGLQYQLESECRNNRIRFNNVFFENWIFNCERNVMAMEEIDPVIPYAKGTSHGLIADLVSAGLQQNVAQAIATRMNQAAMQATERIFSQSKISNTRGAYVELVETEITGKKAREAQLERSGTDLRAYDLTYNNTTVRINKSHYDKLKRLYDLYAAKSERGNSDMLNCSIFCLLVRYHTLQGGHVMGGGMQAALIEDTFDVLLRRFGVSFECFASPLNSRYGRYCSMFNDTDSRFGSMGSFFDFYPRSGSFEANPPFEEGVIVRMANHINVLLEKSEKEKKALSFIVIIPAWLHIDGWKRLNSSDYLTKVLTLPQREHGFCEGTQHSRPSRYRISTCDTSVFFLQTNAASKRWPATEEACNEVREAFRSKHLTLAMKMAGKQAARQAASAAL